MIVVVFIDNIAANDQSVLFIYHDLAVIAGVIALSTYLVLADRLEAERSAENEATPIFHAHGRNDPMVPYERGVAAEARLRELGYPVEAHAYTMGHEVCLGSWIVPICANFWIAQPVGMHPSSEFWSRHVFRSPTFERRITRSSAKKRSNASTRG